MTLPEELGAYRDRLLTRAASWPDRSIEELRGELKQLNDQAGLLLRSCAELEARIDALEKNGEAGSAGPVSDPASTMAPLAKRLDLQRRTHELVTACAEALRRHINGRPAPAS